MSNEKKPYIINGERVTLEEYRKTKYEDLRIRVPIGKKEKIIIALISLLYQIFRGKK